MKTKNIHENVTISCSACDHRGYSPRADFHRKTLPFWVLTGAPDDLVPATCRGAASVDIFYFNFNTKSTKIVARHTFLILEDDSMSPTLK